MQTYGGSADKGSATLSRGVERVLPSSAKPMVRGRVMVAPRAIYIPAALQVCLRAYAEHARPTECCGLLVGRGEGVREVTDVIPGRNLAAHPTVAFTLDPATLLAAARLAYHSGLEVIGCYHSHPLGPSWPSAQDRTAGPSSWSYVIIDGARGRGGELLSYRFAPDAREEVLG